MTEDPFRHVPELRAHIIPFDSSFFRNDLAAKARQMSEDKGLDTSNMYPDELRAEFHRNFLAGHKGDLWVFAYGSLIWDPALDFDEIRRARLNGYARKMCLYDEIGARGLPESPGLVAGLVAGAHCDGMAFHIPEDRVAQETDILWQREVIMPGYVPTMLEAETPQGSIRVLSFVADTKLGHVRPDLEPDTVVRLIATGKGLLGSTYDYVAGILERFALIGIEDRELEELFDRATQLRASS